MTRATPPSCPSCGSTELQYYEGSSLNVPRAAIGLAIAGPIGALAGGVTGQRRLNFVCTDCGDTYNHYLVKRNIEVARRFLGINLNFSNEEHRRFYRHSADELRRCGRINVKAEASIYEYWLQIRRLADEIGFEYQHDYRPEGLTIDYIRKEARRKSASEQYKTNNDISGAEGCAVLIGFAVVTALFGLLAGATGNPGLTMSAMGLGIAALVLIAKIRAKRKDTVQKNNLKTNN